MIRRRAAIVAIAGGGLAACTQTIPPEALQLSEGALKDRQLQTRRFESRDEARLLKAGAQVLQDLGFQIDESESKLGVIVGSKNRDAVETGQVIGAIFLAILVGAAAARYDKEQKIRASLVTRPVEGGKNTAVRITFQRLIWDNHKTLSKIEGVNEPKVYQEFFDRLAQSVFLNAQEI
jgi:hypothetical protein